MRVIPYCCYDYYCCCRTGADHRWTSWRCSCGSISTAWRERIRARGPPSVAARSTAARRARRRLRTGRMCFIWAVRARLNTLACVTSHVEQCRRVSPSLSQRAASPRYSGGGAAAASAGTPPRAPLSRALSHRGREGARAELGGCAKGPLCCTEGRVATARSKSDERQKARLATLAEPRQMVAETDGGHL